MQFVLFIRLTEIVSDYSAKSFREKGRGWHIWVIFRDHNSWYNGNSLKAFLLKENWSENSFARQSKQKVCQRKTFLGNFHVMDHKENIFGFLPLPWWWSEINKLTWVRDLFNGNWRTAGEANCSSLRNDLRERNSQVLPFAEEIPGKLCALLVHFYLERCGECLSTRGWWIIIARLIMHNSESCLHEISW